MFQLSNKLLGMCDLSVLWQIYLGNILDWLPPSQFICSIDGYAVN